MRSHLRFAAVIGAVTLGVVAAAPGDGRTTDNQAGANAVFISVAGNGQGTGNVTATYSNGKETTTGNSQPAFPDPTGPEVHDRRCARPGGHREARLLRRLRRPGR